MEITSLTQTNDVEITNPNTTPTLTLTVTEDRHAFVERFAELMRALWLDNRRTICANKLTNAVVQSVPEFQQYGQQDAHEALSYALNNLHDRRREKRRNPTIAFAGKSSPKRCRRKN